MSSFDIDEFDEISKIKCPNFNFEENNILFNSSKESYNTYDEENNEEEEDEENEINTNKKKLNYNKMDILDEINSSNENEIKKIDHIQFKFKSLNGKSLKFLSFNPEFIKPEKVKNKKFDIIISTLEKFCITHFNQNNFPKKISIFSEINQNELFIFDPIDCDLKNGKLENIIIEKQLRKRANLLLPYKQDFFKSVIEKIILFLIIIKYKIEQRKKNKIINQNIFDNKKNNKTKLKEIEGTNIITFSNVSSFMNSQFGNFNMKKFINKLEENKKKKENKKKNKRLEVLKKKMKETLNQKELDDLESDDENYNFNKKTINRRKDAIPNEILMDSKKLQGSNYKPKQTMNYLNGLKMLIKESSKKK